jgi:uncharacterized membrane protein HdeD (DUF308 family)
MSQTSTDRVGTADRPRAPRPKSRLTVVGLSRDDLRRARTRLLVTAGLLVLTGITAIAVPMAASVATAIFIGWVLVFAGTVMGVHAYDERSERRTGSRALTAVLTLAVGVFLLVAPLTGTLTLTFMLAVWFFALGVTELMSTWAMRGVRGSAFVGFNGVLSLVLGVLIVADLPSSAGWATGLLVGISLLLWGVRAFVVAGLLKRAAEA